MAEANLVEDGIDRLQSAFQSVEDEFEKVQKRVDRGRKDFEKRVKTGRKDFEKNSKKFQKRVESRRRDWEKQTEKRVKSLQDELRKYSLFQQLEELADDASKRFENGIEQLLGGLQIATRSDIQKLDKKLNTISRKLKTLEKERTAPAKTEEAAA
jgi:hypothetical protein